MFDFLKHRLPEGFFRGACDVHCHLLPGVDDGFPSLEKSLHALKELEKHGVKKMILTPHFMRDYPLNNRESITAEFASFKAEAAQSCSIELRLGGEYMLDSEFMNRFQEGFLPLDGDNLVLCETSYLMHEHNSFDMLYDVMCEGIQPVIAHPERYEYAGNQDYFTWKDRDYKFQLNILSLVGVYGGAARAKAHYLLKEGMYDYLGSDMHRLGNYERFLPELKLKTKEIDGLSHLLENNKTLFR